MNTNRTGKIARLPKTIRDELGHRIENGEPGAKILEWLNDCPAVQKILQEHFDGRPINEPNLSDWKQGGHLEWCRLQETRAFTRRIFEEADAILEATQGEPITERFAKFISLEMSRLADEYIAQEADPQKRFERIRQFHHELSRLRRDDQLAARLKIKNQQFVREQILAERDDKRYCEEQRHKELLAHLNAHEQIEPLANKIFKEREGLHHVKRTYSNECTAAYILEVENNLPIGSLGYHSPFSPESMEHGVAYGPESETEPALSAENQPEDPVKINAQPLEIRPN